MPKRHTAKSAALESATCRIINEIIADAIENREDDNPPTFYLRQKTRHGDYHIDLEKTADLYDEVSKTIRQSLKDGDYYETLGGKTEAGVEMPYWRMLGDFYKDKAHSSKIESIPEEDRTMVYMGALLICKKHISKIIRYHYPLNGRDCNEGGALNTYLKGLWKRQLKERELRPYGILKYLKDPSDTPT